MWNNDSNNNNNSNQNIGTYNDIYSPSFNHDDNEINNLNNSNIKHFKKHKNNNDDDKKVSITINKPFSEDIKFNRRKKLIRNLSVYLLIAIITLIIFLIAKVPRKMIEKEKITPSEDNSIQNIYIEGEKLNTKFSGEVHDYYVLTNKKEVEIKCDLGLNGSGVTGCNKKIKLKNKAYYIHQIYSANGTLYNINIKTKDESNEKLISINSVTGIDEKTNTSINMQVNASSESGGLTYSIDNGLTYQTSNSFVINENKKVYLVVRDKYGNTTPVKEIDIDSIDKEAPTANVEITKSSVEAVTVTVFAKDNDKDLLYSFDGEEYTAKNTIEVKEPRHISIYVKDTAGNISSELEVSVKKSDFADKTKYVVNYYSNGSSISNTYAICTATGSSCNITLPTITRDGFEILGWSEDKDSKKPEYKVGQRISINKNMNLYAITKKDIAITFDYNGILPNKHVKNCSLYGEEKCVVVAPEFTFDKGKVIGWNLYEDSESALISSTNNFYVDQDTTLYALAYSNIKMTFDQNGADSISSKEMKCKIINNNEGCHVLLPTIKKENAEILGWNTNPNDNKAEYSVNNKSLIKESVKLYAITRTVVNVDFDKNGADSVSSSKLSCVFYNKDKSCSIKTPTIRRDGADIFGWNTNKSAHTASYKQNATLTVSSNKKLYAITSVLVNVYFEKNGASSVGFNNQACTYYNSEAGCSIKTPSITRSGWNIVGFNRSRNGEKAELSTNSTSLVSKSATYYAVTSKSATVNFQKNKADSLFGCTNKTSTGCQEKCTYYNTSNYCKVKVPYILSKGNEVQLFSTSTNEDSLSGYTPGSYMSINQNLTLYAIVKNYYRNYTYSIIKTKTYGHVVVETEAGCPSNISNNYYNFLSRVYKKAPYIFGAAKMTFTGKSTFESTWQEGSAGMTYGKVIGYRNVDVICPASFDRYYLKTIVHELTHAWDSYYKLNYGEYLSSMPDVVALYNKYSKKKSSNRPLRDYAYSNKFEFVADMYAWYYFLYLDSTYMPNVVSNKKYYPADMKAVVQKYIRIAKNGYK